MTETQILEMISTYAPVITSIITMIISVIIGIKKCKALSDDTIKKMQDTQNSILNDLKGVTEQDEELKSKNLALMQENIELKKELRETMKAIKRIGD